MARQWQCPCGAWLPMAVAKHVHLVGGREPTLQEMLASRWRGRDGEALAQIGQIDEVRWQPHFPRRDKPNE